MHLTQSNVVNRKLEFSSGYHAPTSQRLLFDKTTCIEPVLNGFLIPEKFTKHGYCVLDKVPSYSSARELLNSFIANLTSVHAPIITEFSGRIQLAKVDRIPICHDLVQRSFQALHYDMGQPIWSNSTQTMYVVTALFCPPEIKVSSAHTRVASVGKLLSQRKWPSCSKVDERLVFYARMFGDGWNYPIKVNTYRLACFARVIDAVTARLELTDYVDKTTGDWFEDDKNGDGSKGLNNEYAYYKKSGLNIEAVEERILLRGGDLLIIDNTRAVHGRIGKRTPEEIFQFMYGVKSATPQEIELFRQELVANFTSSYPWSNEKNL